jgi:hypothetical protein
VKTFYRDTTVSLVLLTVVLASRGAIADPTFRRGDGNGNGNVDISDAVFALHHTFLALPATCHDAIDAKDSGDRSIEDAMCLLMHLFSTGDPPPAPFPDCGADPTPDDLDCEGPDTGCPPDPTITSSPVSIANVDAPYVYDVNGVDPLLEDLTYSLLTVALGVDIDPQSGKITWNPGLNDVGLHLFRARVSVDRGAFAEQEFTVRVNDWPAAPTVDPVTSPTQSSEMQLSGKAPAAQSIVVRGGSEEVETTVTADTHSIDVDLRPDAVNELFVQAVNAQGQLSLPYRHGRRKGPHRRRLDPDFSNNRLFYLYYTRSSPAHGRLPRFQH